jgi:Fic family protein
MEPLFPDRCLELEELAFELIRRSVALGQSVHPITRSAIVEVVRSMNSYYSNLIEGHNTHPIDIEKALAKDYSSEPGKRALQIESRAHIEVQKLIETRLHDDPAIAICSSDFLCWIHREFYGRLPAEFRVVRMESGLDVPLNPGHLRDGEVIVHRHIPPFSGSLPRFLSRFAEYEPSRLDPFARIIATAASHHRLAWIHPFFDGNGRVLRLFTHAYLIKTKSDGHGLWMVSRGFARSRDHYMSALIGADAGRKGDFDGRGNLSNKGLTNFCIFFLKTAIDQAGFMSSLLDLDSMHDRIIVFVEYWVRQNRWDFLRSIRAKIGHLLSDIFLRGELSRGEAAAVLSIPERTSRKVLNYLIDQSLLTSAGPGRPVRLGFPVHTIGFYFPKLYPDNIEFSLQGGMI